MKTGMKHIRIGVLVIINMLLAGGVILAAEYPQFQFKGVVRHIVSEDTYGIVSEDGRKYQPVRPLPKEYRKDGLAVVVTAKERKDLIAARMWGSAVQIVTITKAELYISYEDRQAIKLLLNRLDAFNKKDLARLQQLDSIARNLSQEQLLSWLSGYGNFTLHYVETAKLDANAISGFCLYSRELQNGIALSGNVQHALMKFTLQKAGDEWKFTETSGYKAREGMDVEQYILELKSSSKTKFGTDDLAKWKG